MKDNKKLNQFDILVIYYWILMMFSHMWVGLPKLPTFIYWLIVGPILLFNFINIKYILKQNENIQYTKFLYYFMFFAIFISLLRFDFSTIYNMILLSTTILIIFERKYYLKINIINIMFIITILYGVLAYHIGFNNYGYLPNHGEGIYQARVSLFPLSVVGSAMIAIIVLVKNYFSFQKISNKLFVLVAGYLIFFGGSRTILACLLILIIFVISKQIFKIQNRTLYRFYAILIVLVSVSGIFLFDEIVNIYEKVSFSNSQIDNYLYRDTMIGTELSGSARSFIMNQQYDLFLSAPLTGVGTYKLINDYNLSGTEAFLSGLFARLGLISILFFAFFVKLFSRSIIIKDYQRSIVILMFFIIMLSYGVVMVPYDLIFLLFIGLISEGNDSKYLKQEYSK
ncbi:MAG: O-antigen ligase family protein [Bacteroidetes bacterium]|nr:O-antigen ligase family protein [Bacteroidota bacterium]